MQSGDLVEKICRFCLCTILDTNFEIIEEVIREVLKVVVPGVDLEEENENVMCKPCSIKLLAAFNFKSTCLGTDDVILPYIISEEGVVDIKDVYLKEKGNFHLINISDNEKICRLCFQLITEFVTLNEVDLDIIDKYIPQINMNATKTPVICGLCFNALSIHGNFVKNCLDTQTRYVQRYIKAEVIDIKAEENEYDSDKYLNISCDDLKKEETPAIDEFENFSMTHTYECDTCREKHNGCDCETKPKRNLIKLNKISSKLEDEEHALESHRLPKHAGPSKKQLYECYLCDYKTKYKSNLKKHVLIHADPSNVQMYTCKLCVYKTTQKNHFKMHHLKHANPSNVQMYTCDLCDYKTKYKQALAPHQLMKHADPSEVQMNKCDLCDYETKYKSALKEHLLTHVDPSKVQMYTCDACDFKTKYRTYLKRHRLSKHADASTLQIYKCELCDFKTKYKHNLNAHHLKHADPSKVRMYTCDLCYYKTTQKNHFKMHHLKHANPLNVQMYTCDLCDFKTKYKQALTYHQLRKHAEPSKLQIYKCNWCDFATKYKNSLKIHCLKHNSFKSANVQV